MRTDGHGGTPLVSVVVIFHDAVHFLEEAVASVRSQTLTDLELILVDDGSTDGSTNLAMTLCRANEARTTLLHHAQGQRRGMAASRNLGLARASGAYVAFLDADDVWLPEKLSEQLAIMEDNPSAAMIYGRTLIWNSWNGASRDQDFFYGLGLEPDRLVHPPEALHVMLANRSQTPTICNALIRRRALVELGGSENAFVGMFEDQVLFSKLLISRDAYVSSKVWAKYRQHPDSHSAKTGAISVALARRRFLAWLDRYARAKGHNTETLCQSIRREKRAAEFQLARAIAKTAVGYS